LTEGRKEKYAHHNNDIEEKEHKHNKKEGKEKEQGNLQRWEER
jgi:hypothetical protein